MIPALLSWHAWAVFGWILAVASPAAALTGWAQFSALLYSRPTWAAGGLLLIMAAFAMAGGGALLVRVG